MSAVHDTGRRLPWRRRAGMALLGCCAASSLAAGGPLTVEGTAVPVVVLEAGLGDTGTVWRSVQQAVARDCARTVSYARAGYGRVHPGEGRRDAERVVAELREALGAAGLPPPYVLVGHSLGGLFMQYYARRYPEEVRGLVLVDSTHWNQLARIKSDTPASYRMLRVASLAMQGAMREEFRASEHSGEQVAALPVTPVPTIVLSSTRAGPGEGKAFRSLAETLQREIAARYNTVRHEFVAGSGHYIQRDRPAAVITATRELAGCTAGEDVVAERR